MFHEIEKAVVTVKILKKEERFNGAVWKPKTLNNESTNPHSTFGYVPQSLKTRLQKKPKTSLKTQKQIKNHNCPI